MAIYEGVLCMALADRSISDEEEKLLVQMQKKLGLTDDQHRQALRNINVTDLDWEEMRLKGKKEDEEGENGGGKHQECIICLDKMADHVILDCMHLCLCEDCHDGMSTCPKCRQPIKEIRKVFF
eukprot:TRINITY_DN885_c0_g1_i1.p1 TRINITY_DN885_c0_g1~~TRINITY_DN885_c0_g1_i1.p1  ORF type:complete len:124 (+),score=24.29 TRINITY_DN885_c0_g1_i1:507-878(+)